MTLSEYSDNDDDNDYIDDNDDLRRYIVCTNSPAKTTALTGADPTANSTADYRHTPNSGGLDYR